MSQYPTAEEEFELMYGDDLDMHHEDDAEAEEDFFPWQKSELPKSTNQNNDQNVPPGKSPPPGPRGNSPNNSNYGFLEEPHFHTIPSATTTKRTNAKKSINFSQALPMELEEPQIAIQSPEAGPSNGFDSARSRLFDLIETESQRDDFAEAGPSRGCRVTNSESPSHDHPPFADESQLAGPSSARAPSIADSFIPADGSQLSQIPHVNRRLFGTPMGGPGHRIASTPMHNIDEELEKELEPANFRKRRLEDLFGDIRDIEDDDCYGFQTVFKKVRTDEERDLEMIEKILLERRKYRDKQNPLNSEKLQRLEELHKFKKFNLATSIPKFPFVIVRRDNSERVYVRFHSEEFETRELSEISVNPGGHGSLLGDERDRIWEDARKIVAKREASRQSSAQQSNGSDEVQLITDSFEGNLWVDKYRPKRYIDLLSDESTNRSLLFWLKMWDKVVFNREFKPAAKTNKPQVSGGQAGPYSKQQTFSNFNKKTGRFEQTGGWKKYNRNPLNTETDELGRPQQKVALLCGPPGLGKTTLAHTIAKHAGYEVREMNASDDRSPEAFRHALENGTQMRSLLNEDNHPNCIILDEIDGAPAASIEFLIKFISDNVTEKVAKVSAKGAKAKKHVLRRPIICICNDMYTPALRQLRQIAFVVNFPPIDGGRLAERLQEIADREGIRTDMMALNAMSEKSGNDVRSCISMLQFFGSMKKPLTLLDVLKANIGQKDRHKSLFGVWSAVFQIQRPKKAIEQSNPNETQHIVMTDMSERRRMQNILDVVHRGGDYDRLMQGVFENFLSQKMSDHNMTGCAEAADWFTFNDIIQRMINQQQNYAVYPYLQFAFVAWHFIFGSLVWPKIKFPSKGFEMSQKAQTTKMIFLALRKSCSAGVKGIGDGSAMLIDAFPFIRRIICPSLRSVSLQLLTPKERYDLSHAVQIMADFGLAYTQTKAANGTYQYQMEPDVDAICQFDESSRPALSYWGRQTVAREVELEQMRRATPKLGEKNSTAESSQKSLSTSKKPSSSVPNHLQQLQPKTFAKRTAKEIIHKDFFGRIIHKPATANSHSDNPNEYFTDDIVKSPIWYRYKEGYNNAVRKDIYMKDLL